MCVCVCERERERERERYTASIQPAWLLRTGLCSCLGPLQQGNVMVCRHPAAAAAGISSDGVEASCNPLVMEASFQRPLTEGITLTPALVCVHDPGSTSIMAGFRLEALC